MINLEEAKRIDPQITSLTDEEITLLLQDLYETANVAFDIWQFESGSKNPVGLFLDEDKDDKI